MENYTTSGLRLPCDNPTWYCGRVSPGRERLFERGLHRFNIQTYYPVTTRRTSRNVYDFSTPDHNRLTYYTREFPLFPGYVFVNLDLAFWPLYRERVAYRPQWLRLGTVPAQIPIELIEQLQMNEHNGFIETAETADYREGDKLEVSDGVWTGRRGILASDPDRRILTLHLIAESYALQPTQVVTQLKIDRQYVRRALM